MTQMEKNDVYDEFCHVLTDYETGDADAEDLYEMMCKIQNMWDYLTGDTDD